MKNRMLFIIVSIFLAAGLLAGNTAMEFETGKIIPKIRCQVDPDQSYALYLPKKYTESSKWPILYLFEPGARSMIPMKLFQRAAEKYNFILLCSNNSKNGPTQDIVRAIKAVWVDSHKRLSIDKKRIYASGFSGGARTCSIMHYLTGKSLAGIIAFGAGLQVKIKPEDIKPASYLGVVGMGDFNYKEMIVLGQKFAKIGVDYRMLVYDGAHDWGSEALCTQSLEWMVVRAMRRGLIPREKNLMKVIYDRELAEAQEFEMQQNPYLAYERYSAMKQSFSGMVDITGAENGKIRIAGSTPFKTFMQGEKKRAKVESNYLKSILLAFKQLNSPSFSPEKSGQYIAKFHGQALLDIEKSNNIYQRSMATRVLAYLYKEALAEASRYVYKKDNPRAGVLLRVAVTINPKNTLALYNLACIYALRGEADQALDLLERAVKNGFTNSTHIKQDSDLSSLRGNPRFQSLLRSLKGLP